MARKKHSRPVFMIVVAAIVVAGLAYAFWPRAMLVDIGTAETAPMIVTINEEGRTRVHNAYVVSTPIAGRLLRVEVEPGDVVEMGSTVVAQMLPTSPSALDVRTREQAQANATAVEAGLRVAQADLNKALADRDLAETNLERTRKLFASGIASKAAQDRDETSARLAAANLDTARAAISMRIAELNNARAQLISFDDKGLAQTLSQGGEQAIPLFAPADGVILQINQQSEITLPAGSPVMEIGNVSQDLEIVSELLSTDAVAIDAGTRVIIDNWGGVSTLAGVVARVEPLGFTKVSALGVEEQRVRVTIEFEGNASERAGLGHGFRVETRIVTWEDAAALTIPASSLFRDGQGWAVFTVDGAGVARQRGVDVAANNGMRAAISTGLVVGEQIVLYPSAGLTDGTRVKQRLAEGE